MTESTSQRSAVVATILDAIERVAPDVDAHAIPPDVDIRIGADLDSMDFLAVVTAISERTGIEIPERAYGRLRSIDELAAFVHSNSGAPDPLG